MFYPTETKFQNWRALAVFEDGAQCLLFVGRSTAQVRAGYEAAYKDVLDEEERAHVLRVCLQCWEGAADQGRWITKDNLALPMRRGVAAADGVPLGLNRGLADVA